MLAVFAKAQGQVLVPVDAGATRFLKSLKLGEGMEIEAKKVRNVRFHRKFFKLLRLAFDSWEPDPDLRVDGVCVRKDFESFREHILILSGHCEATYGVDGSVKLKAKSIAFDACDDFEFDQIYQAALDVVWSRVLRHVRYRSPQVADNVVQQLAHF